MSRSSADDRRLDVLRAIVTQYVATREPVGSKAIAQSHDLGVSSATIRNDMAVLEDAGLIYQPHTSAGRVPTDRGYRVFVDRLATLKPMTAPERRAVEGFLSDSADIDDVVERTVRLLAQFTRQVALVQYPATSVRTLRHLEVVDLAPSRLLVVVITDQGEVVERSLSLGGCRRREGVVDTVRGLSTRRGGYNARRCRQRALVSTTRVGAGSSGRHRRQRPSSAPVHGRRPGAHVVIADASDHHLRRGRAPWAQTRGATLSPNSGTPMRGANTAHRTAAVLPSIYNL